MVTAPFVSTLEIVVLSALWFALGVALGLVWSNDKAAWLESEVARLSDLLAAARYHEPRRP